MSTEFPFELPPEAVASLKESVMPDQFPPPNDFAVAVRDDGGPAFLAYLQDWTHELRCGYAALRRLLFDYKLSDDCTTPVEREADEAFMFIDSMLQRSIERGEVLINWIRTTWPYDPAIRKQFGNSGKPVDAPTQ